jgi:hypothetical protein
MSYSLKKGLGAFNLLKNSKLPITRFKRGKVLLDVSAQYIDKSMNIKA